MQAKTKYRGPGKTEIDYYIRLGKVQVQGPGIQATQKKIAKNFKNVFCRAFSPFCEHCSHNFRTFFSFCRFFLF